MAKGKSKEIDMLHGSLWDKILVYALPLAATGILQQLFNAADVAVVGRFTGSMGPACMAAVGACSPVVGLVLNFFVGISLGSNVVIANGIGRQDDEGVHRTVHTSILISLIGGLIIMTAGEIFAPQVMSMMNVPKEVMPLAVLYLRIYLIGLPVILLYNFEAAIFRGIGDTKTPLLALIVSGVLNVILNLFFVIVCDMAVDGVATATVISNAVSSIMLFVMLLRSKTHVRIRKSEMRISGSAFSKIMRIGLPSGIQMAVFAIANVIIQSAINSLGTTVMAASSAAMNIEIVAYFVLNSFSQACTTFVGQNNGAGDMKRCRRTLNICLLEDVIASAVCIGIILFFGHQILSLFNTNPKVISIGYSRLVIIFIAYIFSMLYEVLSGYLRGFGISILPALLTVIGVCGVRITWIYTIFPVHHTFRTIMMAYPASLSTTAVLIFIAVIVRRPASRKMKQSKENTVREN